MSGSVRCGCSPLFGAYCSKRLRTPSRDCLQKFARTRQHRAGCPPRGRVVGRPNTRLVWSGINHAIRGDPQMAIRLGDSAPDFSIETTEGTVDFLDWKKGSWA